MALCGVPIHVTHMLWDAMIGSRLILANSPIVFLDPHVSPDCLPGCLVIGLPRFPRRGG